VVHRRALQHEERSSDVSGDGSVVICHRVADPHWVVGHALQYGGEAEILEPADLRALVLEVAEGLAG
jgi:predicted DNA-binding transcriptional regulator YafY